MTEKFIFFLIRNKLLISILLFIATAGILILTMLPPDQLGESEIYEYDKLGHFGLFFVWTFIFGLFIFSVKNYKGKLFFVFICGSLFGIGIEFAQEFLSYGRSGNMFDALADITGCFAATLLLNYIKQKYFANYRDIHRIRKEIRHNNI